MARIFISTAVIIAGMSAAFVACQPVKDEDLLAAGGNTASAADVSNFADSLKSIGRVEAAVSLAQGQAVTAQDPLADQLRAALLGANCTMDYVKNYSTAYESHSSLKIAGSECPMTADYQLRMIKNGAITVSAQFEILRKDLIALNDIYQFHLEGTGSSVSSEDTQFVKFTLKGEAQSRSSGKIILGFTHVARQNPAGNQLTMSGTRTVSFVYPKFSIDLKSNDSIIEDVDNSSYELNGQRISKQEYLAYVSGLGILFN